MCYAIPGKIVELKGKIAVIDYFGEHKNALNEFVNAQVGDYVYAQGGILVDKIDEDDAIPILSFWKDRFAELKKIDNKISKIETSKPKNEFEEIIQKAQQGNLLQKQEALTLLKTNEPEKLKLLYKTANSLRQKNLENACCVHGIIEFSNYCRNNCTYCGIRSDNKELKRYKMSPDEIVEAAVHAVKELGFKALVLQSGEDTSYTTKDLVAIIKKIKQQCGVLLSMSVGQRSQNCYKEMYDAGARGVLLRFETSNQELYKKFHKGPKANFQERIDLLKYLNKLGYIIATGSIIGFPNQTEEDILNDILLTKSLNAEMYSFGPLIPHPQTPLKNTELSDIDTILKVLAVSRFIDPNSKILVTTALETLDKDSGKQRGLLAGANSLMINVTPSRFRKQYTLYPGRPDRDKEITKNIEETLKLLYSLGRAPTDLGI